MKKKILVSLLCAVAALSMTACGNKPGNMENPPAEANADEKEETEAPVEEQATEEAEEASADYKTYPMDDRHKNNPLFTWQVDDMVFEVGMSIPEILETIENAEAEYELYYTKKEVTIEPYQMYGDRIDVTRNGSSWFRIYYSNLTDEPISSNDCVLMSVIPQNEAFSYTYLLGMTPEEFKSITKENVDTLMEPGNVLEGFTPLIEFGEEIEGSYEKEINVTIDNVDCELEYIISFGQFTENVPDYSMSIERYF